jgi:hypothetical protein
LPARKREMATPKVESIIQARSAIEIENGIPLQSKQKGIERSAQRAFKFRDRKYPVNTRNT